MLSEGLVFRWETNGIKSKISLFWWGQRGESLLSGKMRAAAPQAPPRPLPPRLRWKIKVRASWLLVWLKPPPGTHSIICLIHLLIVLMVMLHSPPVRSQWERKDEYGWTDEHKCCKWFLELLLFSLTGSDGRQSSSVPRFESSSALYVIFPEVSAALWMLKAMGIFLREGLGSCLPGFCAFIHFAARAALANEELGAGMERRDVNGWARKRRAPFIYLFFWACPEE